MVVLILKYLINYADTCNVYWLIGEPKLYWEINMEQFCTACNTTHDSPKWYNNKENNGSICKKSYLREYYKNNGSTINSERRKRYQEDPEYRKETNERNKENDKLRRSSGYVRIRKPRSEWTEDEKQQAKEAKQRYKKNHPDRVIEQNKKQHAKHYRENIEAYAKKNPEARDTAEYQYSYLVSNSKRRKTTVEITFEQFKDKVSLPCNYCHRDSKLGIDRLDSSIRIYNDSNTVPCCSICNYLKGIHLTEEETLYAIIALNKYLCDKKVPDKINFAMGSTNSKLSVNDLFVKFNITCRIRGIESSLTKKNFSVLLKQPCFYCGGVNTGLDRLDNKDGYHIYNCVPCCGVCNRIKADIFDLEETFVMINMIQKIRLFYSNKMETTKKLCVVCGTEENPKWIKHPTAEGYLCGNHYKDIFSQINDHYYTQFDVETIYNKYYENILNRTKNPRKKDYVARNSQDVYERYKQIIESRQMELLTTYEDYMCGREKHKLLTIKCNKDHVFQRDCTRVKQISTCPNCVGVANKGGAFKEKILTSGWTYVSGGYINKQSILTAMCEHSCETTNSYNWLRRNSCKCLSPKKTHNRD